MGFSLFLSEIKLHEGLRETPAHVRAWPSLEHSPEQEALATDTIRAGDLRQSVFTVVPAPSAITA